MQDPIIKQPELTVPPVGPLVGSEVWQAVMERAGYRCQCNRCPGKCRRSMDGCPVEAGPGVRLIASPLDPGPDPLRTVRSVPVDQLRAWCPKCWDRNVRDTRRFYRQVADRELADRADTLF